VSYSNVVPNTVHVSISQKGVAVLGMDVSRKSRANLCVRFNYYDCWNSRLRATRYIGTNNAMTIMKTPMKIPNAHNMSIPR
jgi:hypothetical protein